ncbi:MAG TPA: GNAT family N-acetyltransferase [Patescibacteria group bacterium]|nr:GNAT family N-acetyltransferase [Patescibacteria group bacterium]
MEVKILHNRQDVFEFLKDRSRYDYLYEFFDLDENNWENVICYGLLDGKEIKQIAMLLIDYDIPVLLAACYQDGEYSIQLMKSIKMFLPSHFYTHIDKKTLDSVFSNNDIKNLQEYMNMGLEDSVPYQLDNKAVKIGYEQIGDIRDLLSESYPEAGLYDRMIKLGRNFGIYCGSKLVSFAGIHAYSEEHQVAAVAHVTTHPDFRRQGFAETVIESLIKDLQGDIQYIGLNVKTDNIRAINCYKKLGFKEFGRFVACEVSQ